MKTTARYITLVLIAASGLTASAAPVNFGTGGNQFAIDFVPIGNPGNAADTTGDPNPAGSVPYVYNIAQYEISRDMVSKASAVGGLGITLHDMISEEIPTGNGLNRPATGVSWNEAARFVNWLNTSQDFQPAYKFATQPGDGGYSANEDILLWDVGDGFVDARGVNQFRHKNAHYFLPSVDEWYKAAYHKNDGVTGNYWNFPTGSDSAPTAVASGTGAGAVYGQPFDQGPANITQAGGLSPYGVMGLGGNVWEWGESEYDLGNDSPWSGRDVRGGVWDGTSFHLSASFRILDSPSIEELFFGFRVASIPEPSSLLLGLLGGVGVLGRRRRSG